MLGFNPISVNPLSTIPTAGGGGSSGAGSATGTSTADGFFQVAASTAGTGVALAVAGAIAAAAGTTGGQVVSGAVAQAAGTAGGTVVAGFTAQAAGTSTADAFSQGGSVAAATGTSTAQGTPGYTAQGVGTSSALAVSQVFNLAVATAAGTSTADGVMGYTGKATGTSQCFGVPFGAATFGKGNWVVSQNEFNIWAPSFTPSFGEGKTLSVTSASSSVSWAASSRAIANAQKFLLVNQTAQSCFVRWGVGAQTALVDVDMPLSAYGMIIVTKGLADTVAAITPTGTTSLSVMPGVGV